MICFSCTTLISTLVKSLCCWLRLINGKGQRLGVFSSYNILPDCGSRKHGGNRVWGSGSLIGEQPGRHHCKKEKGRRSKKCLQHCRSRLRKLGEEQQRMKDFHRTCSRRRHPEDRSSSRYSQESSPTLFPDKFTPMIIQCRLPLMLNF